ncbi:pyrroloquinoline quinone precursor peptide PqqA [Kitasatospora sp. NPDC059973]|uniref:pyrroloquinoline quinone precursor peptide PqqA n=1 Tax=Kitasatospora sp. NPDC059973 TaxID=3347020 RepID=UPI00367C1EC7
MNRTAAPLPTPAAAPPERPADATPKPAWSAPAVECHRTGAEVTAYAGRAAQWLSR